MEELSVKSERLIHIDLKSCPLKISYLHQLFQVFSRLGGTGLLIEWEDTFPYDDHFLVDNESVYIQAPYKPCEIQEILCSAKQNNLSVIPLVQTFGHLEFILKNMQWRHLREVDKYCSSICPSHPESFTLITSMITQILKYHPDSKFLHIGGDEVWHLGMCDFCKHRGIDRHHLFMEYIVKILQFVHQKYPHVTAIMWDDMLRGINESVLNEFNIGKLVEPMIWEYQPAATFSLTSSLWEKYEKVFNKVWIASAYKGATGSCQILPVISHHVSNHDKWLNVVAENQHRFTCIRGIAMTGWSRYDHFAVLCELMPAGITSLAICLKMWLNEKYDDSMHTQISNILGLVEESPNLPAYIPKCLNFPGYQIYLGIEWFANVRVRFNDLAQSNQTMTWLNPWYVKRNYTSRMQVEHIFVNFKTLLGELKAVEKHLLTYMPEAFYDNTIQEWLGCYLIPIEDKMMALVRDAESQLKLDISEVNNGSCVSNNN